MNDIEYDFPRRLKYLREIYDLDRKQMADKLNTSVATLCRYENDKMRPTLEMAISISRVFNVTLDWLAGGGDITDIQNKEEK